MLLERSVLKNAEYFVHPIRGNFSVKKHIEADLTGSVVLFFCVGHSLPFTEVHSLPFTEV